MTEFLTMLDTTDESLGELRGLKFDALAGYVTAPESNFRTYDPMVRDFPELEKAGRIVSIAPQAFQHGRCLDMEAHDATIGEYPGWHHEHADTSEGLAIGYCSASDMAELVHVLAGAALSSSIIKWSAHYTGRPHICSPHECGFPTADMTQWTDKFQGRNVDASLVPAQVFRALVAPDPHRYEWFLGTPVRIGKRDYRERHAVETYDELRRRPHLHARKLHGYRIALELLADRVRTDAYALGKDGAPDWAGDHRGWRFGQLRDRAEGRRLA